MIECDINGHVSSGQIMIEFMDLEKKMGPERIFDFVPMYELTIVDTFFLIREYCIIYKNGGSKSQVKIWRKRSIYCKVILVNIVST